MKLPRGNLPIEVIEKLIAIEGERIQEMEEIAQQEKRERRLEQKRRSWHKHKNKYRSKEVK